MAQDGSCPPSNCTGESAGSRRPGRNQAQPRRKSARSSASFDSRAIELKRERWRLRRQIEDPLRRDQILRTRVRSAYAGGNRACRSRSAGQETKKPKDERRKAKSSAPLSPQTLVLTFDDGPTEFHTGEIAAILKQYGARRLLPGGQLNQAPSPTASRSWYPGPRSAAGCWRKDHTLANHSLTHASSPREWRRPEGRNSRHRRSAQSGRCAAIILDFPYGARNEEGTEELLERPFALGHVERVPSTGPTGSASIAERVLKTVDKGSRHRLFHDITSVR